MKAFPLLVAQATNAALRCVEVRLENKKRRGPLEVFAATPPSPGRVSAPSFAACAAANRWIKPSEEVPPIAYNEKRNGRKLRRAIDRKDSCKSDQTCLCHIFFFKVCYKMLKVYLKIFKVFSCFVKWYTKGILTGI